MEPDKLPSNWENLITGYVLGDLSSEEATLVKQYLETYPELASEVESLQATLALFPLSLPETKPSEGLRSKILQAAATELNVNHNEISSPSPPLATPLATSRGNPPNAVAPLPPPLFPQTLVKNSRNNSNRINCEFGIF